MKKIFSILAIAALMAGCSKEDSTTDVAPATFTLTGYTSNDTRTAFGTPDDVNNKIPFIWSEGDKIWSDSEQSNAAVINGDGSASFTFASEPATTIYYNMTGTSAAQANVPAEQSIANNLGQNGDFGYATVENGSFTLEHATAYLWFNTTTSIANATLKTITINADGVNIAGKATWSGSSFGAVSEGKSEVTLTVNQPLSSTNGNVWAMVVLPADLSDKSVKVVYKLNVGGDTKYYTQTLSGKKLPAGTTQKISANISEAQLTDYRELRVLTFEDSDAKFGSYTLDYCSKEINKWSDLIAEDQYMSSLIYDMTGATPQYHWYDEGHTELYHEFPYNYGSYAYWGGGHAISDYANTDYETYGDYNNQLTVYGEEGAGGHNGSKNFCMHYGYQDGDPTNYTENLSSLSFGDGKSRVIDHMYVNASCYFINCIVNGNSLTRPAEDGDELYIYAIGYDENGTKTGECSIKIVDGDDYCINEWTKWDLTSLGQIARVEFNVGGTVTNKDGFSIPAYFAYDDVAVQF